MATSDHTPRTIEIQLTQGQVTYIDAADADLAELGWYAMRHPHYPEGSQFKAGRKFKSRATFMHRIILARMLGRELLPGEEVDHIDRDPLNNRRSNLRLATRAQNNCNQGVRRDNTSGYKGVGWRKSAGCWVARIRVNGKRLFLGNFDTAEEAHKAYCAAAQELHGEFARLE